MDATKQVPAAAISLQPDLANSFRRLDSSKSFGISISNIYSGGDEVSEFDAFEETTAKFGRRVKNLDELGGRLFHTLQSQKACFEAFAGLSDVLGAYKTAHDDAAGAPILAGAAHGTRAQWTRVNERVRKATAQHTLDGALTPLREFVNERVVDVRTQVAERA